MKLELHKVSERIQEQDSLVSEAEGILSKLYELNFQDINTIGIGVSIDGDVSIKLSSDGISDVSRYPLKDLINEAIKECVEFQKEEPTAGFEKDIKKLKNLLEALDTP